MTGRRSSKSQQKKSGPSNEEKSSVNLLPGFGISIMPFKFAVELEPRAYLRKAFVAMLIPYRVSKKCLRLQSLIAHSVVLKALQIPSKLETGILSNCIT